MTQDELPLNEPTNARRLRRTRRLVFQTYVAVGALAVLALTVFGPGWTIWLPLMTLYGLSSIGLGRVLGVSGWSESDSEIAGTELDVRSS